jgi:hypothetical protein
MRNTFLERKIRKTLVNARIAADSLTCHRMTPMHRGCVWKTDVSPKVRARLPGRTHRL